MNTQNTQKEQMRTNTKTIKNTVIALVIGLTSLFSINASAQNTPNVEVAISQFVVAQGQQMMNQLNEQLQQSIANEVKEFTLNFSLEEIEQQVNVKIENDIKSNEVDKKQMIAQVKKNNQ
tara:strand:+ start:189 stop:548 length:360 start_codon:yes stop_codon:yes gene_type:complete